MSKNKIVLDLEATCDAKRLMTYADKEIIEIGACLIDENFDVLDRFQTFIKPVIHPVLDPFCIELTKISQDMVDGAPLYKEAMGKFDEWFEKCVAKYGEVDQWMSWGDYDRKQFIAHALIINQPTPKVMEVPHLNLKACYAKARGAKKEQGVGKALAQEQMSFQGTPHRAIDDALNIARLAPIALGAKPSLTRTGQHAPGLGR